MFLFSEGFEPQNILILILCYYQVTYKFQSESTRYSLSECQWTPCSKQAPYLKFKWQQRDSNPQHLVRKQTVNHLWLSVRLRTKWLWVRKQLLSLILILFFFSMKPSYLLMGEGGMGVQAPCFELGWKVTFSIVLSLVTLPCPHRYCVTNPCYSVK